MRTTRSSTLRRAAIGGALAGAAAMITSLLGAPAASAAPPDVKAAMSGVGYADANDWGTWRGRAADVKETWNDAGRGEGNMSWDQMNQLYTVWGEFSDGKWNGSLSLAQPMWAQNESVQSCATDDEITTFLGKLGEAWPRKDAWLRLNWEFNGSWYPWYMNDGDQQAFISCWHKWHDLAKAASPNYKLVWNPNAESSGSYDVTTFWPGAEYVDAAGPDYYGWANTGGDGAPRDPDAGAWQGGPLGINTWQHWVADKGVAFAVPEWGVKDGDWGWSSPDYIVQMRTAFQNAASSPTGLGQEAYFDGGPDWNCQFSLHSPGCGNHQAEAAKYVELFSRPYVTG